MIQQLRHKFVAINMVIVTAVLLVMFVFVYRSTGASLEQQSLSMMETVLPEGMERTRQRLEQPPEAPPDGFRNRAGKEEIRLPCFTLREEDGTLTASGDAAFDLTDEAFLSELAQSVEGQERGVLSAYSLRYLVRTTPAGSFTVFADISSEQATLRSLLRTCALVGAVSLLAFLGVSIALARWAVGPVERAWQQQRQFVADASHELKTPLTVITTNAELLKDPAADSAERLRCVDSILTMSSQMRGLVEGLLELARADNGSARMTFQSVDLSELAEDAVMGFEPVFFERGLTLESDIQPGISVNGSAQHLKQVADILLDNAQKYASPGAAARFTLQRTDKGRVLLTVANQGEPIPQQNLEKLFQRFYRADTARSMNHSYGLGLSIARSIVQQHQGRIWAESEGGWNRFLVRLNER